MTKLLKVEMVQSMFSCELCFNTFVSPITMPCGVTICQTHLNEFLKQKCIFCKEHHARHMDNFQVNKSLQKMIDLQLNTLKLSPSFEECKKSIAKLNETIDEIDLIYNDTQHFVFEYFEEIKRQVDLRKEKITESINIYSDNIIQEVVRLQDKLKSEPINRSEIFSEIESTKVLAEGLINRVDTFEINDKVFDVTKHSIDTLQPIVEEYLERIKSLLVGYQVYEFKYEEFLVDEVFGIFSVIISYFLFILFSLFNYSKLSNQGQQIYEFKYNKQ